MCLGVCHVHVDRGAFIPGWAVAHCLLLVLCSSLVSDLETVPALHLPCPLALVGWPTLGWPPITQSLLMNLWIVTCLQLPSTAF